VFFYECRRHAKRLGFVFLGIDDEAAMKGFAGSWGICEKICQRPRGTGFRSGQSETALMRGFGRSRIMFHDDAGLLLFGSVFGSR
jgi:hypothetical protein